MTDEGDPAGGQTDPIVSWGSIPGAGGTTPDPADTDAETTTLSNSAYEKVRGLLAEPGPRVGASALSEKMAEEMESFDQRWSQRPVSVLVSAGKKMADQNGSVALNRLLGLTTPPGTVPDPDPVASDEEDEESALDTVADAAGEEDAVRRDKVGDPESEALVVAAEAESAIVPLGGDDDMPLREPLAGEPGSQGPRPEPNEDQTMTITPTARMVAAQAAYKSLNPLEAEIFRSQAGLVDLTQARDMSTRAQRLALDTFHSYERETIELRQELVEVREEADAAAQAAATRNEELTAKVTTLEGQLELLAAELVAARNAAAEGGDDSEGGAGRELVKDHDDLRPEDEEEPPVEIIDDEVGDVASEEPSGSDVSGEEISAGTPDEDGDEGDGGMAQKLQRLAQGSDKPALEQNFGE